MIFNEKYSKTKSMEEREREVFSKRKKLSQSENLIFVILPIVLQYFSYFFKHKSFVENFKFDKKKNTKHTVQKVIIIIIKCYKYSGR